MRSLLITGASGFLGWHACRLLSTHWQVLGTYHTQPIDLASATAHPLDLTDEVSIQRCWDAAKPAAVLHLAAISKANRCQQSPDTSRRINVEGALALAERCAAATIPFVFTSTDLVFDGTHAPYDEAAQLSPVNIYGQQKAAAEKEILALYPDAAICRLPLLYGAATPTAGCFLQDFLGAIAARKALNLFTDEIRTAAEATDVIQGLRLVLEKGITGILHLGGHQRLSRYQFGLIMADAFNFPSDTMTPCLQSSVNLSTPRPKDVSLNSQKAFSLGYAPRSVEDALAAISAEHPLFRQ